MPAIILAFITGIAFMPYLTSISFALLSVESKFIVIGGADIISLAIYFGGIFLLNIAISFSFASTMVISFSVADAAVGCPPPPSSLATSPTFTSFILLLAIRCILSSSRTSANRQFKFSMSLSLCTRMAMSPIYVSDDVSAITT
ncbi:MAG: hypothetical protein US66_C0027G0016 [Candidatus Moranbacteria bacterium GW2011_GWD2_37_9]|nr:MAG: hypothetical protein US66_C0027G0016 [Candidatus Moranbacteria bacterium GW2011_GWD2_37_9]